MKVYIDSEHKCHTHNDGTMVEVETEFFDGKCDAFVEGYCYEIKENAVAVYPWKPYSQLDSAQRAYEQELIADMQNALHTMGVTLDE